jgi:hypothetical protein
MRVLLLGISLFLVSCVTIKTQMLVGKSFQIKNKKHSVEIKEGKHPVRFVLINSERVDSKTIATNLVIEDVKKARVKIYVPRDIVEKSGSITLSGDELGQDFDIHIETIVGESTYNHRTTYQTCYKGSTTTNTCQLNPNSGAYECFDVTVDITGDQAIERYKTSILTKFYVDILEKGTTNNLAKLRADYRIATGSDYDVLGDCI